MNKKLSGLLRSHRLSRYWGQAEMARLIGIPQATYWQIESGRVEPRDYTLARIKEAFPEIAAELEEVLDAATSH